MHRRLSQILYRPTLLFGNSLIPIFSVALLLFCVDVSVGQQSNTTQTGERCVVLELFTRNDCENCPEVTEQLKEYAKKRGKIKTHVYNLDEPGKHVERYEQILKYFRVKVMETPVLYGCNTLHQKLKPDESLTQKLDSLLTVNVYVRSGCPRCARAKVFLSKFKKRHPEFQFKEFDLVTNVSARSEVQNLATRYRKGAASVPVFHFCNQLMIGWNSEQSTGRDLETKLSYWTRTCPKETEKSKKNEPKEETGSLQPFEIKNRFLNLEIVKAGIQFIAGGTVYTTLQDDENINSEEQSDSENPVPESASTEDSEESPDELLPPIPGGDTLGPPPGVEGAPPVEGESLPPPPQQTSDTIDVPLFGELSLSRLGMPAFTFLIGLVDGFNPCAMWVLLFLLSVLVNLKSRKKILAVAGSFVLVSGLAYFAFMAAWLNVFMLVGYLPAVQLTLGIFATVIGLIHVKDFFAFKKGITLSIPEWAKPGLYARVRKIVMAENLTGAIIGAIVLAVLVNIIELLCTAGLPALYTNILSMQNYPTWKTYAYLGLYNVAYMLDDSIMVAIVVITLGRRKLQEKEGRWLKLFSGLVILALGLVLIFKPSLLH